jgi:hypothetical protein
MPQIYSVRVTVGQSARAQSPNSTQFHRTSWTAPPHNPAAALYQNTAYVTRLCNSRVGAGFSPASQPPTVFMEHEYRVHYHRMRNITLSADEQLIEQARLLAKSRHKTLNAMFREWLEQLTAQDGGTQEYDSLMKRLKHVQAGRHFTRDEMNER